jgi:hypothetical protein
LERFSFGSSCAREVMKRAVADRLAGREFATDGAPA